MELWTGQSLHGFDQAGSKLPGTLYSSFSPQIPLIVIDILLQVPRPSTNPLIPADVSLHYLSVVDPARIPLHLVAGQALEVYTSSKETEIWIGTHLVEGCFQDLNSYRGDGLTDYQIQSDTGVLMGVEGGATADDVGPQVTELLLYAIMSLGRDQDQGGVLTPLRSSSPTPVPATTETQSQARTVRIYALPLSSDLCYDPTTRALPSPPPEASEEGHTQFLPPIGFSSILQSRKRRRLNSLFDDATQHTKRARRHGGETVAKVMASIDNRTVSKGAKTPTEAPVQPEMLTRKRPKAPAAPLSRAHSVGSFRDLEDACPISRSGPLALTKRSSLHRVASVSRLSSSSPGPEPASSLEQQNKNSLSRIIMAGMRMYGLQQRKKLDRSRSVPETVPSCPEDAAQLEGEEHKLVYHQTYKAAAFIFRKHMASFLLSQDVLRDTTDHLLSMFCSDPLTPKPDSRGLQSSLGVEGGSVFDSPSDKAALARVIPTRIEAASID